MKAASELTLAEQLYLLAYDPAADEGTYLSGTEDAMVRVCLAGALLIELFERELIYERPDGIVAVVERPGELPSLLEDAMTAIPALLGGAEAWVYGLKSELKPIEKTVARSLVKRGVLAEERGKVLGLFPWTRFPTLDPAPRSELLERVHAVLLSTPRPDPTGPGMIQTRPRDPSEDEARLITLLELLALDMIELLVPRDRRKQARRRARQLPTGLRSAQGRVYRVLVEANQIP